MEKPGLTVAGVKYILKCGEGGQGRKCLVRFLKRTGLIGNIMGTMEGRGK